LRLKVVAGAGIEPSSQTSKSASKVHPPDIPCAGNYATAAKIPQELVRAWPGLSKETKRLILLLVREGGRK